jgi:hypothetical protein
VEIFIFYRDRPWTPEPVIEGALATLSTAYEENTFPKLPVREGEHALVALARPGFVTPELDGVVKTEHLRLMPTDRSALR